MTTGAIINLLQEGFVRQENIKAPTSPLSPNTGGFLTDIPDLFPANGDLKEDSDIKSLVARLRSLMASTSNADH